MSLFKISFYVTRAELTALGKATGKGCLLRFLLTGTSMGIDRNTEMVGQSENLSLVIFATRISIIFRSYEMMSISTG